MKKKQIWTLEHDEQEGQVVFLRSHLGRYLASDKDGKITCGAEKPDPECRFLIVPQSDGRWALQSEPYLRYFGGSADYLSCFAQAIGEQELWAVHLALHPQASLLSVARKRYAHLSASDGEISVDSNIPWGVDSLVTLVYLDGKYSLKTCDSRFLSNDGKLVKENSNATSFTLELKSGKLAFKDCDGKYLTPMGPTGTLKSGRCSKPGKDELFDLEESHPQVVFQAANKRFVSVKQGVSISANQDAETDMETFQMEIDKESKKSMFRTNGGSYWTLVTHGEIQSTATEVEVNTMFDIEWRGQRVALKASNGKYVCTKKNGQLSAVSDTVGDGELFLMKLINRPMLILSGENGFVCHHKNSNTLNANRSVYDIFSLIFNDGAYNVKSVNGKFWYVSSSGLVCSDGEKPEDFFLEFPEHGRIAIKCSSGKYLRGDQGGANRSSVIPSFTENMSSLSEAERHLLGLHKVVVIMLPLSLVLLVFGWIFGLVSSLASSPKLLAGSASYFLFCSLFTLTGVSIYIKYSNLAMEEFERIVSPENFPNVDASFGWSLAAAWLSYSLEVATGLLLMLAARISQMKGHYDSGVSIAIL
ncbi:Fascin-2 Retinal fascin [Collichthys lucidus]|uniref:Fascin-2 Retinal fascin n=1 Tax=Collichthys lucidus TaxID=240159 RepID=A0A4V6XZ42_COLLU|nr:Fascin-2 Retinal fascin [Collichthys lucidus]